MVKIFILILGFGLMVSAQEIALTFDDAPRSDTYLSGKQRSIKLVTALKNNHVQNVIFFVKTSNITGESQQRLKFYTQNGHRLGNHSHSHLWLKRTDVETYKGDVLQAHKTLQEFPSYVPFFRFPFLDEGDTPQKRDAIRHFLEQTGLSNGYVTVDNYDWYLDALFQRAMKEHRSVNMEKLGDFYVSMLWGCIRFYDQVAIKHLGRSPRQILLLHENDLAAMFLPKLIQHIRAQGWTIISPLEAYRDPIASQIPNTLFNGQGRVAALAAEKGVLRQDLVHKSENEAFLDTYVREHGIIEDP